MKLLLVLGLLPFLVHCGSNHKWIQRNVGVVDHIVYDMNQADVAYVASRQGVIASINVRSGKLYWRQVLPVGEIVDKLVVHKQNLVTLSAGRITRVWNTAEKGALLWEDAHFDHAYEHPKKELGSADIKILQLHGQVCVLTLTVTGDVRLRDLERGTEHWSLDHNHYTLIPARGLALSEDEKHVFLISFPEDHTHMRVLIFETSNGAPVKHKAYTMRAPVSTSTVLVKGQFVIMLAEGSQPDVDVLHLDVESDLHAVYLKQNLPISTKYEIQDLAGNMFAINTDSQTVVNAFFGTGVDGIKLEEIEVFKPVKAGKEYLSWQVGSFKTKKGDLWLSCIRQNFDGAEVQWVNEADFSKHQQIIPYYDHRKHGDVLHIFPHVTNGGQARALIISEDFALNFVKSSEPNPLWTREESLALTRQVKVIDFPVSYEGGGTEKSIKSSFGSFTKRVQEDINYVVDMIKHYTTNGFDSMTDPEIFGFKKLIVVLSESGKLFGIDSLTGKIVMKKFLPTLANDCKPLRMFQIQDIPTPVFLIVLEGKDKCVVLNFDIVQEAVIDQQEFSGSCGGAFRLPFKDGNGRSAVAILTKNANALHFVPSSVEADIRDQGRQIFFHTVDKTNGKLEGFGFNPENFQLWTSWIVDFTAPEQIIDVHVRDEPLKIADTLYRPGGARKVMFKYLNPHLIVAVTKVSKGATNGSDQVYYDGIHIYLIDSVNGRIISHKIHQNAVPPVAVVVNDNYVHYSYWDTSEQQNVLSGLSLWINRKKTLKDGIPDAKFSSFTAKQPDIVQRSWLFQASPIIGLSVSSSRYGFAKKVFLATLASGQVYRIDSRFVDPRQVDGDLKAADKEEELLPYTKVIPYIHPNVVTEGNEIAGAAGLSVGTANVESTSVMVVYGIDFFSTLMTPMTFDMLSPDFDKFLLGSIVTGVVLAIGISRYFAKDAKLRRLWE